MKIAFFGYDFFVDVVTTLVSQGHSIMAIFAGDADNFYNYNIRTVELAKAVQCPVRFGRPSRDDMVRLKLDGCDLILVMAYQYKVPVLPELCGLNLHPTLLPEGRGVWPLPWLILKHPECAGLTLHCLAEELDAGPIIARKPISLTAEDNLESLTAKVQMAAPAFVTHALENLDALLDTAVQQSGGSTWPMPEDADRELDWSAGVDDVLRVVRAFGKFESTAVLEGSEWMVTDAWGWKDAHVHRPGTVVQRLGREVVVAVSDGYVLLRHYHREIDFSKP